MSIKRKKKLTPWGESIDEQMKSAPRVTVAALAAKLDVVSSTLYAWLAKANLDDRKRLDVERTLSRLKAGDAPRRLGKTADRPVDQKAETGDGSDKVKHDEVHMEAGGTLRAKATVVRSPLGHMLDKVHQLEQMAHEYHEQGEQKMAQACTEAAGVLKIAYQEKRAS